MKMVDHAVVDHLRLFSFLFLFVSYSLWFTLARLAIARLGDFVPSLLLLALLALLCAISDRFARPNRYLIPSSLSLFLFFFLSLSLFLFLHRPPTLLALPQARANERNRLRERETERKLAGRTNLALIKRHPCERPTSLVDFDLQFATPIEKLSSECHSAAATRAGRCFIWL